MFLAQCLAVAVGVRRRKKFNELKNFHFYPIAGLFQTLLCFLSVVSEDIKIIPQSISMFLVIEFSALYLFALRTIVLKVERIFIKILFGVFIIYALAMWMYADAFVKYYELYLVQSIFLIIASVIYFFQLFRLVSHENLATQPSFWINIGVFFFFSSTIPLYLLESNSPHFIDHYWYLYSINYTAYGIFYLLICKAYLCKTLTRLSYSLS